MVKPWGLCPRTFESIGVEIRCFPIVFQGCQESFLGFSTVRRLAYVQGLQLFGAKLFL